MAEKKTSKKTSHAARISIGIAAAAAVATAGAYFLYGAKNAAKNRKKVKGWALKAKAEVLEAMEKTRGMIHEVDYHALVDRVMKKYQNVRSASSAEVTALSKELKSHWKHIHKVATPKKKKTSARTHSKRKAIKK